MKNQLKVVGVCSANVERSGIFEAVMKHELSGRSDIVVSSAGINVEKILTNTSPLHIQIKILSAGLKYGLVRDEIKEEVEKTVSVGNEQEHTDKIRALYGQVRPLVHGYLLALRNQALKEVGINEFPAPYTPFKPENGFDLVLPMAEKDIDKVSSRYDIEKPVIRTYGDLAGIDQLVDDVSGGLEGARRKVEYFMDTRKTAIERMKEYV